MKRSLLSIVLLLTLSTLSYAANGLIDVKSIHGVQETTTNLERILNEKGLTVFNRVKHSQAAQKVGIKLPETELLIFGNPKVGSPLMQCQLSVAIDLPLKALIWKDTKEQTWISYNDPEYLKERHQITNCDEVIAKMAQALNAITHAASN